MIPPRLGFATQARAVVSGGAQTGVISGGHRAPLNNPPPPPMFGGAQTDRKTGRQVDPFHFLLMQRAAREEEE